MNIKEMLDKAEHLAQMKRDLEVESRENEEELLKAVLKEGYIHCITINKAKLRRTVYSR